MGHEETFGGEDIFAALIVTVVSWVYVICPNGIGGIHQIEYNKHAAFFYISSTSIKLIFKKHLERSIKIFLYSKY